jgi:hypothetical protein
VELYMAANQYRLGDLKQVSFDIIFHWDSIGEPL